MDEGLVGALLAVGLVAGFFSALFGIGGGIIMVPFLHYVLGYEWHTATALSLLAIAIMSPWGVLQHARRNVVVWRVAGWMVAGGAAGILIGLWLEPHVPVTVLKLLFSGLLLLAAYRMVARPIHARWHTQHPAMLVTLGLAAGIASKLLGIGGGLVTVPVLTLLGTPIHAAVGSSLVPVFTNGAFASAGKLAQGASLWLGVPMAMGGLAGIPLGAWSAHALPALQLKRVFAVGLVLAASYIGLTSGVF